MLLTHSAVPVSAAESHSDSAQCVSFTHVFLYFMYVFLYTHTYDMFVLNGFSLAVCPRRWPWLPVPHSGPCCSSILSVRVCICRLPAPRASLSSPSAASSLICVDFRLVLMLRLKPVPGHLHLRKATLLGPSPREKPVTPVPAELGEGAWGGLGC